LIEVENVTVGAIGGLEVMENRCIECDGDYVVEALHVYPVFEELHHRPQKVGETAQED
jgi:hypothetical protein